jgi:predicted RNA-binding protein with RPS1 domain
LHKVLVTCQVVGTEEEKKDSFTNKVTKFHKVAQSFKVMCRVVAIKEEKKDSLTVRATKLQEVYSYA